VSEEHVISAVSSEVLHTGKRLDVASAWQIAMRCRAHHMLLEIVMRRKPPSVIAIGPPADKHEPEDQVMAVRLLLFGLGKGLGLDVRSYETQEDLAVALDKKGSIAKLVQSRLNTGAPRDRRVVLAAAAALAALASRGVPV
jgi:hypothetical protein